MSTVLITNESESKLTMILTYSDKSSEQIVLEPYELTRVHQCEFEGLLYPKIQFYKVNPTPTDAELE